MNNTFIYSTLLFIAVSSALPCSAEEQYVTTDRYTLVKLEAADAQREPLKAVITLSFGSDITTVGNAIEELLKGSGYQWQKSKSANDSLVSDQLLFELPLPSVLRTIGPLRLEEALSVVAGEAWQIQTDELNRTIWFTAHSTATDDDSSEV